MQQPPQENLNQGREHQVYPEQPEELISNRLSRIPQQSQTSLAEMQEIRLQEQLRGLHIHEQMQEHRLHEHQNRIPSRSSGHLRHPSDSLGPDAFVFQQHQMHQLGNAHSPSLEIEQQHQRVMRHNQYQQSIHANAEINTYIRSSSRQQLYSMSPDHLKQRMPRQVVEQEILEAKHRRKMMKISRMVSRS